MTAVITKSAFSESCRNHFKDVKYFRFLHFLPNHIKAVRTRTLFRKSLLRYLNYFHCFYSVLGVRSFGIGAGHIVGPKGPLSRVSVYVLRNVIAAVVSGSFFMFIAASRQIYFCCMLHVILKMVCIMYYTLIRCNKFCNKLIK